jgi:hypothetical protein
VRCVRRTRRSSRIIARATGRRGSQPPEPIRVTVDDWRWLGPVRAFHRAVYEHRGKRYEYEYTQIRFNDVAAGELAQ